MPEDVTLKQYLDDKLGFASEFYVPPNRRIRGTNFVFRRRMDLGPAIVDIKDYFEERGHRIDLEDRARTSVTMRFVNGDSSAFVELTTDAQGHLYVSLMQRQLA